MLRIRVFNNKNRGEKSGKLMTCGMSGHVIESSCDSVLHRFGMAPWHILNLHISEQSAFESSTASVVNPCVCICLLPRLQQKRKTRDELLEEETPSHPQFQAGALIYKGLCYPYHPPCCSLPSPCYTPHLHPFFT